ncbi:MAG TPA: LacI family DNA-binding transcriptional regulator [Candidatus Angelobacter sp.]|nr:LacI family DNA-binding transcriptional regulator [Candidatus Angelobacter sp.]
MSNQGKKQNGHERPVSLKFLAKYLDLSPATISVVLNDSPTAQEIPQRTKDRVLAAVSKFKYRPNVWARSLRRKRSHTIGVLVHEISEGYGALLLNALDDYLLQEGYFYFVVSHRRRADLLEEYPKMLMERSVEGFIVIDTVLDKSLPLPAVNISGHTRLPGVTNVVLDHQLAAKLALQHLVSLGHQRIAFIKGQPFSSDSEVRWKAIQEVAHSLSVPILPKLTVQLEANTYSPVVGYPVTQELLSRTTPFTALLAYNDLSAIGAIRAIREHGLRVPEDVSVVGFDDIASAAFQNPSLTTVRQPLQRMGATAARILLERLNGGKDPGEVILEPEFVVRESTAPARDGSLKEFKVVRDSDGQRRRRTKKLAQRVSAGKDYR